ncbi:MAG: L-histidine N(alpha)-methyltransferase [Bacteroidales bacterium]
MLETNLITETYRQDIISGLKSRGKYIPSKYFYDDEGSRIFQEIMRMPEYYLTDCEFEIFKQNKDDILERLNTDGNFFDLVELGAGDGLKTSVLIDHFMSRQIRFKYVPVDISEEALAVLTRKMETKFPTLTINDQVGDYFEVLGDLNYCDGCKKITLFLGSNIGNYTDQEALGFFNHLSTVMKEGDMVLTGFDLIKDPEIIMEAYDDPHGYTRDFNLNLLARFNRELGANFSIADFEHKPVYDEKENAARSYLKSLREQEVFLKELELTIHFEKDELIYTEMSKKFSPELIEQLANKSGFKVVKNYFDRRKYFIDSLWEKL